MDVLLYSDFFWDCLQSCSLLSYSHTSPTSKQSDQRQGQLPLRQLQVSKFMVDIIEQSDILIDYHLVQDNNMDPTNSVSCDDPLEVQFHFTNASEGLRASFIFWVSASLDLRHLLTHYCSLNGQCFWF